VKPLVEVLTRDQLHRDFTCPVLSEEEGLAVAALLDELAGVYNGEDLGQLARELAVRIYDRLGVGRLDRSRERAWA
jgi:hypothetical protein